MQAKKKVEKDANPGAAEQSARLSKGTQRGGISSFRYVCICMCMYVCLCSFYLRYVILQVCVCMYMYVHTLVIQGVSSLRYVCMYMYVFVCLCR